VGSVFSPYYAWARARGNADPANHCAVNVALYGPRRRWTMTERGAAGLQRSPGELRVGPSSLAWDGKQLVVRVHERASPWPMRVCGEIRLTPDHLYGQPMALDARGAHRWRPIAPSARVEVRMTQPELRWDGAGYLDANDGDEPLEQAFSGWHWSRARLRRGTAVLYDLRRRDGSTASIGMRFGPGDDVRELRAPPAVMLPATRWGVARATRSEVAPGVLETFEDTPFYARSLLSLQLAGERVSAMHESLSLDRFRAPWVRMLLPFRMPRVAR
jgi:carotenoid 1,2-hydratase